MGVADRKVDGSDNGVLYCTSIRNRPVNKRHNWGEILNFELRAGRMGSDGQ